LQVYLAGVGRDVAEFRAGLQVRLKMFFIFFDGGCVDDEYPV
jgi:hypothetical protein